MQKQLNTIMQKEMTRKEFLATLGFGIASIFGFSTLIRLLTNKQSAGEGGTSHHVAGGYGSSVYGGGSPSNNV